MIGEVIHAWRRRGFRGVTRAALTQLRGLAGVRAAAFVATQARFAGGSGFEIGGPSQVFSRRGLFPVYAVAARVDNGNFGNATVWEGAIREGDTFRFEPTKPPGTQYVIEAAAMWRIPSGAYDFVLASHVLEHVANPILALTEWSRLLNDGGTLVLLLPRRQDTFDHRRPVTTFEHLRRDFDEGVGEDDLTHLPEILALHDLARDPEAGDRRSFEERSRRNAENRCFHHHVFDALLLIDLVRHVGLHLDAVEEVAPHHILVVAHKGGAAVDT